MSFNVKRPFESFGVNPFQESVNKQFINNDVAKLESENKSLEQDKYELELKLGDLYRSSEGLKKYIEELEKRLQARLLQFDSQTNEVTLIECEQCKELKNELAVRDRALESIRAMFAHLDLSCPTIKEFIQQAREEMEDE